VNRVSWLKRTGVPESAVEGLARRSVVASQELKMKQNANGAQIQ